MTKIINMNGKQIMSDSKIERLEFGNKKFVEGYNYHRNQSIQTVEYLQKRFRRIADKAKDQKTEDDATVFLALLTELKTILSDDKHNETTQEENRD